MDRVTRGRLVGGLLATSSMAALLTSGFIPEAQAAVCSTTLGPGAVAGCTNTGVLTKINVNGANVTGNVSNSGTISPNGISLTNSTINGGIIDSGTVAGGVSVDATSKITAGAISISVIGSTFTGGVTNSGFINASNNGIAVIAGNGSGTHGFSGGIINNATLSAGGAAILVRATGTGEMATFSGNIANTGVGPGAIVANVGIEINVVSAFTGNIINSGSISVNASAVSLAAISTFTGGITNSGTISAATDGININTVSTFTGGVTSTGSITYEGNAVSVVTVGTFQGGISNGGAITGEDTAIEVATVGTFAGGITNSGSITSTDTAIKINTVGTFTGGISNSGTITGTDTAVSLNNLFTFSGGISNSGTISTIDPDISVQNLSVFNGGISNSGTISTADTGVSIHLVTIFNGGISNSGTITAADTGIRIDNVGTFAGGISNSNTISAGDTGINIALLNTFTGGITNTGTITSTTDPGVELANIGDFSGGIVNGATGTIAGATGIRINSNVTFAAGSGITNSGTIQGTGGTAIDLSTASLPVTIDETGGTLVGTILFSTLDVDTLTGNGTLVGSLSTVGTNATIWPTLAGTGILKITGSFTQGASSTVVFEINPTTASLLAVGGTATLAGPGKIVFDPGTYTTKTYTLITVGTSHTGTFSGVTSNAPSGINESIDYTPANEVDLDITGSGTVGGGGGGMVVTTNTAILGDPISLAQSGFFDADGEVFDHLDEIGSSGDGVKTALAAASPIQLAFNGGIGQLAQAGSQLPNALAQVGGWVRGIGNFQSADTQGAVAGYSANGGGFLAGIDHAWGNVTLGVAAGYSGTNIKQNDGSTGDVQTPRAMVYAHYRPSPPVMIDGVAGFAYDSIHTVRPIAALGANATENHSATEENLALQAGYALPWQGITIVPRIGAQYLHLAQRGYSETGASGFDLTAPTSHIDSFQPVLSVSASEPFTTAGGMRIVPEVKLSYSHELLSTSQTLAMTTPAGSVVAATAITPARDTITLGPQVTAAVNNNLSLYADYKLAIGVGKSLDNVIFAGARVKF